MEISNTPTHRQRVSRFAIALGSIGIALLGLGAGHASAADWHWYGKVSMDWSVVASHSEPDFTSHDETTLSLTANLDGSGSRQFPGGSLTGSFREYDGYTSGPYGGSCTYLGAPSWPRIGSRTDSSGTVVDQYLSYHFVGDNWNDRFKGTFVFSNFGIKLSGTSSCTGGMSGGRGPVWGPDPEEPGYFSAFPSVREHGLELLTSKAKVSSGAYRWSGTKSHKLQEFGVTWATKWTYNLTLKRDAPACLVVATSPQRIKSGRLVSGVKGARGSCQATLKSVALKVNGKNRFFSKSSRSSKVARGKSWTVGLRYGPVKARVLKKAIRKGQKVTALITYVLDGVTTTKTVRLR